MNTKITQEQKLIRAKKKVASLKGYYFHLAIFIVVNSLIIFSKVTRNLENGETLEEAIYDINTFGTLFLWGVPMLLHTFKITGFGFFFGKKWEEKKINEYLND
ncbi:2TM domain-containing protein [Lutibacter sp. Hel_I_33_5]|uniref:2TM domain-containing protein n=1 Tax=Lutibacter sp. Hel_I_33_5 TaxID=1566289 RepID=UPI00119D3C9A|nr:2TM domain-containing protein [Lutibacter sp. Hel_I_33_5]TVZ55154.1 2TM domain-containing protein [Lutibacter sp. Hel_I_33_5]